MTVSRLVALPLIWLVRGYQLILAPLEAPSCRFYPSCSAYALDAVSRFGAVRGCWLAVRRIVRCHPWAVGGYDPVPKTYSWRTPASARVSEELE